MVTEILYKYAIKNECSLAQAARTLDIGSEDLLEAMRYRMATMSRPTGADMPAYIKSLEEGLERMRWAN